MNEKRKNLSERMRQARTTLHFTQLELAERAGIHATTYSNIEAGRGETFNKNIYEVFDELGIDLHWLITGEGAMFRKDGDKEPAKEIVVKEVFKEKEKDCANCKFRKITDDMLAILIDKVMDK